MCGLTIQFVNTRHAQNPFEYFKQTNFFIKAKEISGIFNQIKR